MTKTEALKSLCVAKGLKYVGTRGCPGGPIALVGEAPGADEDQAGVPFVGAAGRELDKMLWESGIDTGRCWWTNPYKVRPPDNKLVRLHERGIPLTLYEEQFIEEMHDFKPTFIVALGATPLGLLCPFTLGKRTQRAEISKWRGSLLRSPKLPWEHYVVPAYHPAFLFRDWTERQNDVLCLAKVQEEFIHWGSCGTLRPLPSRQLVAEPAADDVLDYLRRLLQLPSGQYISVDIENIGVYSGKYRTKQRNRIPYVVGISHDPSYSMSIGLAEYDRHKAIQIWRLLDVVLRKTKQVYQNGYDHDIPWLQYIGFSPALKLCHDTMVRHWVLWPECEHTLQFQTFQYTREPYYKDQGKNWTPKEGKARLKRYNCLDCCVTLEIFQKQEEEFKCR